ncbi:hypothetical protein H6P81_000635 [Aristolochia fimbriata]|uniref:Uncharacterized protein n=1 Tax=Aristolochia fimbriata TaxID=158543 RepID=A0AAV7F4U9_ARIFI|nr:hypothetical protein H6P81_000635 [Aristolochia fimbriata]
MGRVQRSEQPAVPQLTQSIDSLPQSVSSDDINHGKESPPAVLFPPPTSPPENVAPPDSGGFQAIGKPWTTGLFDCHEHLPNAVLTAFCPCVTFGQIVEILENGATSCALGSFMYLLLAPAFCSHWMMGSMYRARLRSKYNLVEAPTQDCIAHACCPLCSLCQEFRELRNRGIDPSLGWNGNLALQQQFEQQIRGGPPVKQSMSK